MSSNSKGTTAAPRSRSARTVGGAALAQGSSPQTRRLAAAILEVLAGARTPAEAAAALGIALPRYYQLESQALRGLVAALAPKPQGRQRSADSVLAALRRDKERLQREVQRQQALVRLTQRTVGLAPPAPPTSAGKGKRKPRRRVARALTVAARLTPPEQTPAPPSASPATMTT
jgi:hypothetical protein